MIDKPIPAKILVTFKNMKPAGTIFFSLSNLLYHNNLIFSEPREIRQNKNTLELMLTFRDLASFKNWLKFPEIKNLIAKFETSFSGNPRTIKEKNIIVEMQKVKNCTCNASKFLVLQGRSFQFMNELTCNNCLGQISFSKIPLEINIEDWQTKYERVYRNWLESGLFEKEAYKELTNYKKGKLHLAGEKIRQQLSAFFKVPVYFNYFAFPDDEVHSCPICSQPGIKSGLKKPKKICKTCNTIFEYDLS